MSASHLLWACRVLRQRVFKTATKLPSFGSRGLASNAPPKFNPPKVAVNRQSLNVLAVLLATTMCGAVGGYSIAHSTGIPSTQPPQTPKYGTAEDFKLAIKELKEALPREGGISTDEAELIIHGDSPYHHHDGVPHSVVVYPESTEDVVKVVKIANKYRMPVVPYGGATSLEGQVGGHAGGCICVNMSGMDEILEIHEADADLVCQPGVGWMTINETLRSKGIPLFFPIDPGPSATIGGMVSTGCSGTNAVRYGTAKGEWFLNLTVVLPSGEVIKTRRRSRKSSAGFDLTKLFIGAEGTLGIITEVTIRLAPVLPTTVATVQFPNVGAAAEAVRQAINVAGVGASVQCVELVDDNFMAALNRFGSLKRKYLEKDGLFFKFQGHSDAALKEVAKIVKGVCEKNGGSGFKLASGPAEAEAMWSDRKNALNIGLSLYPGARGWSTDVCVPVSKLPELVYETKKDIAAAEIPSILAGHAGDGNFHALLLWKTEEELEVAKIVADRLVKRALDLDGTCTGEHGVGIGKKKYLVEELGPGTVELMKKIKRTVDPLGLFNPGKLYPD
ncbi:D-lactate dehydrogenase [cytochrome], mitochondrial [Mycena venus]|uniref:D-lactate dehydrogenase (cytochrome) n=1 Tax=Mycena venus TaxID=2733690 RepID=A0A8H6YGI6_9AGAR|nr:D-lactate dehydrogenase [cytochrome], mitochondrial [Mycena venus]